MARVCSVVPKAGSVPGTAFQHVHKQSRKGMNNELAEFADDTKLFRTVSSKAGCEELQRLL